MEHMSKMWVVYSFYGYIYEESGNQLRGNALSPWGHIDHTYHTGKQDPFEQPGLWVHINYGAYASKHGSAEQKL